MHTCIVLLPSVQQTLKQTSETKQSEEKKTINQTGNSERKHERVQRDEKKREKVERGREIVSESRQGTWPVGKAGKEEVEHYY